MESCNTIFTEGADGLTQRAHMTGVEADGGIKVKYDDASTGVIQPSDIKQVMTSVKIPFTDIRIPLRFDSYARLMTSPSETIRKLTSILGEDPMGTNGRNAMIDQGVLTNSYLSKPMAVLDEAADAHLLENKVPVGKREAARTAFMENITRIVRGDTKVAEQFPEAAKAVAEVRNTHARLRQLMIDEGIEGADAIPSDPFYMRRQFNHGALTRLTSTFGKDELVRAFAESIYSKRVGEIKMEQATKVAKSYVDVITMLKYDHTLQEGSLIGSKSQQALRMKIMTELGTEESLADEIVALVVGDVEKHPTNASFLKYRTKLDENFTIKLKRQADGVLEDFRIDELFENRADKLVQDYTEKVAGMVALKRRGNLHDDAVWNRHLKSAELDYARAGGDPAKLKKELEIINGFRNYVAGRPMIDQPFGTFERVARSILDFNFFHMMGQAGFAQLAEFGTIAAMTGLSATLRHVPAFSEIGKMGLKGKAATDQLGRDLAAIGWDSGTHSLLSHPRYRKLEDAVHSPLLSKSEQLIKQAAEFTSDVSGMSALNEMLRRTSERALIQRMHDAAIKGGAEEDALIKRMFGYGVSPENLKDVLSDLKKYVKTDDRGVVSGIDYENWQRANNQSFSDFVTAGYRASRQAAMLNSPSEMPWFVNGLVGKILMQFRSFPMAAHAKMTLAGFEHKDSIAAMTFIYGSTIGAMSYVAQTLLNYGHDPEELEKRLQDVEILKGGIQRSTISGVIPMGIDTGASIVGAKPVFNGRSTNQATDFLSGNPTFSTINSVAKTIGSVTQATLSPDDILTQKEATRGIKTLLPNFYLVNNAIHHATSDMPKDELLEKLSKQNGD